MENPQTNPHNETSPSWVNSKLGKLAASTILVAEITPVNEVMRTAVFVGAQARFDDPAPVAIAYGLSTLAIELAAGLVAADIVSTDGAKSVISRAKDKIHKLGIPDRPITNRMTELGIGVVGGSAVQMLVKHTQDPEMTRRENRRYATTSAIGISAVCGVQGYLVSSGISHPSIETIGGALLAVGATVATLPLLKSRFSKKSTSNSQIESNHQEG